MSRFIRLTYLIPDLLDYVDRKKLKLGPAIQISFLEEDVQDWIAEDYACTQRFPSVEQVQKMRKAQENGTLDFDAFEDILAEQPEPKKEEDYLARIRDEYFPDLMKKDVEEKLAELIEQYFHRKYMDY